MKFHPFFTAGLFLFTSLFFSCKPEWIEAPVKQGTESGKSISGPCYTGVCGEANLELVDPANGNALVGTVHVANRFDSVFVEISVSGGMAVRSVQGNIVLPFGQNVPVSQNFSPGQSTVVLRFLSVLGDFYFGNLAASLGTSGGGIIQAVVRTGAPFYNPPANQFAYVSTICPGQFGYLGILPFDENNYLNCLPGFPPYDSLWIGFDFPSIYGFTPEYTWSNGAHTQMIKVSAAPGTTSTFVLNACDCYGTCLTINYNIYGFNTSCDSKGSKGGKGNKGGKGSNGKILVCHNPPSKPGDFKEKCISPSKLESYFRNSPNDYIGECGNPFHYRPGN